MSDAAIRVDNPFPGLRPFREDEEYLFFGREEQVDAMVDKLAATHFLAVVGTSGSGKSSLVNCGLRPALRRGLMAKAGAIWRMAQFRPGANPLRAMAEALAKDGVLFHDDRSHGLPLADLVETTLRMSKRGLLDIVRQASLGAGTNLLLVVDQFEELFRFTHVGGTRADRGEMATAFVNLLLEVKAQTELPIYVVLTMRSDFLGDCTKFPGLAEAINAGQYLVPRLTRSERKAAIRGPINVAGAAIAPVLLTRLVNDVGDDPDQLSILQHALNRTWTSWEEDTGRTGEIALPHYLKTGTMAAALDEHANEAFESLLPGRQRAICEKLFRALTDKATDARGVRRPTRLRTLCEIVAANDATAAEQKPEAGGAAKDAAAGERAASAVTDEQIAEVTAVIDVFRDPSRSFLMPPADEPLTADSVIDISHESLMRVWKRLDGWATAEAESARRYQRLADSAILHREGNAALLQKQDLKVALRWRKANEPNAVWAQQYTDAGVFATTMAFLDKSRRVSWGKSGVGMLGLVALFAAPVAGWWYTDKTLDQNDRYLERIRVAERLMSDDSRLAGRVLLELEGFLLDSVKADADRMATKILRRGMEERHRHVGPLVVADGEPSGRFVVSGGSDGAVEVWTGGRAIAIYCLAAGSPVRCVRCAPGGTLAWVGFGDGSLLELDWHAIQATEPAVTLEVGSGVVELEAARGSAVRALAVAEHDGNTRIAAAWADGRVAVRDTGQETWSSYRFDPTDGGPTAPEARCLALSPTGTRLVAGASDGTVVVLERARGGERLEPIRRGSHEDRVVAAAFGRDEDTFLTASWDGSVRVWRIAASDAEPVPPERAAPETPYPMHSIALRHSGPVLDASWRMDGGAIVTAGEEGAIVWRLDRRSDEPVWLRSTSLDGHVGAVRTAMFGVSSMLATLGHGWDSVPSHIVTACEDGHLRVFEWPTGRDDDAARLCLDADEHFGALSSARYVAYDEVVVTCGEDGDVRVWAPECEPSGDGKTAVNPRDLPPGTTTAGDARLRLVPLGKQWQKQGLPEARGQRPAFRGSELRQLRAEAQQIAEEAAASPLAEDLADRARAIWTRVREALYEPWHIGTPRASLDKDVAELRAAFDLRSAASDYLERLLGELLVGRLKDRATLDARLGRERWDETSRAIAAEILRKDDIARAWQQLATGDCRTEDAWLASLLAPEADAPKSETAAAEARATRVEATARQEFAAPPAPRLAGQPGPERVGAVRRLREDNRQAVAALRAAFGLARQIERQLAPIAPSVENWQRPRPSNALMASLVHLDTEALGAIAFAETLARAVRDEATDAIPSEFARRLQSLQDLAGGAGNDQRSVPAQIGKLDGTARERTEQWWGARQFAIVASAAAIFARELRELRRQAEADVKAANDLRRRPSSRTNRLYRDATILVANFDGGRAAVQAMLNTVLVASFERQRSRLTALRDELRPLDRKLDILPEPKVPWSRQGEKWLDDFGTDEQRRLIRWDEARGYWFLTGRDVPMVLVGSEELAAADKLRPFFIDAHEVTFGDFRAHAATIPGPAKGYWDRAGAVYERTFDSDAKAFAHHSRALLFTASPDAVLGAVAGYASAAHALARYLRTMLFGVSLEAADAYARSAYPRRTDDEGSATGVHREAGAPRVVYGERVPAKPDATRPVLPELKLAIPTYQEWCAAMDQQWGGAAAAPHGNWQSQDLRTPPREGEGPDWDAPPRGIHGLRSGLAEWVRDVVPAAPGQPASNGVAGVSLFRPWTICVAEGRVPFGSENQTFFADPQRWSAERDSREEDAFGFRCVFRLDPYAYEPEAGK